MVLVLRNPHLTGKYIEISVDEIMRNLGFASKYYRLGEGTIREGRDETRLLIAGKAHRGAHCVFPFCLVHT